MRRPTLLVGVLLAAAILFLPHPVLARDAARDLRRMVGYTIVGASAVSDSWESKRGDQYLKLENGLVFRVSLMFLAPLSFTDVIIFAKGKDPASTSIRLLIDNEAYDAVLVE